MSEERFAITMCAIICSAIVLVAIVIAGGVCLNNSIAFNAGYECQQKHGTTEGMWVKATR